MMSYLEISELLEKSADETAQRIASISDETAKSVIKTADSTSQLVQQSADEISKLLQNTSIEIEKRLQIVSDEFINKTTENNTLAPSIQVKSTIAPVVKVDTLEHLFSAVSEKIGATDKDQRMHLKAMFLKATFSKNIALFKELMIEISLINEEANDKNLQSYATLLLLNDKDPQTLLNAPVLICIQKELAKENEKTLVNLLLNVFQSIPESSNDKSGICLSMRLKKKLLPKLLEQTEATVQKAVLSQLTDLSFDSSLPAFRPSIGDKNYVQIRITHNQYLEVINKGVDPSIFIALTIGYLKSNKLASGELLQHLSADYLFVDYENCLKQIEKHFETLVLPKNFPEKHREYVCSTCQNIRPFDHKRNDTRRFFETRLAQYINGLTHSEDSLSSEDLTEVLEGLFKDEQFRLQTLDAANKILNFFLGDEGIVTSPLDMERKISIFANGYKDKEKYDPHEVEHFQKSCLVYGGRDRISRAKETGILERKYEISADNVGADTWNSAGGVMTSISPTFYDAQREPMRNMLVDTSQVDIQKMTNSSQWFWSNNRSRAAYVGSISGHTCNIVFMLNFYMTANQKDPNLSQDINLFLLQLVAVYAKRGYHGMLEVIDVLHDPVIQKVFKAKHITLDFVKYFHFDKNIASFLEYAMNDTSVYALVLATKEHLKESLSSWVAKHGFLGKEQGQSTNEQNQEKSQLKITTPIIT